MNIDGDHYGLNHCQLFTNYDDEGDFFGTRGVVCNKVDKSEYATECHIDNYLYLPIGHNFMRAGSTPYNSCGLSPINDNEYEFGLPITILPSQILAIEKPAEIGLSMQQSFNSKYGE